uniref:Decapping nuclease n=1 Tax=Haematobia irritans TaxID=7368 RepID=A0A1L8EBH2_HAEIR
MMSTEGSNCSNAVKNKHSTVKVYTGRRALTQIMEWPYENKYDFNLWISRYNNELYMTGVLSYLNNTCSHHDRLQQLLFSDSPDEIPNIDDIPNRTMGQSVLHQSKIGKYTLLYAGEAQGIISDKKIENFDDIDALDKCRFVFTKQLWKNLNPWVKQRKLLKFWIQSYLSNVDDLYVAYKNDDGNVTLPIEYIKVSTIPQEQFWKPSVSFGFLHYFLEQVEQAMSNVNCLDTVYEFTFKARDKTTSYKIYEGKSEKSFIPKKYSDFVNKENQI